MTAVMRKDDFGGAFHPSMFARSPAGSVRTMSRRCQSCGLLVNPVLDRHVVVPELVLVGDGQWRGFDEAHDAERGRGGGQPHLAREIARTFELVALVPRGRHVAPWGHVGHGER